MWYACVPSLLGGKALTTDAHRHEWKLTITELGDAHAICRCGHERLLTGTVVRYRRDSRSPWETPYLWNKNYYRSRGHDHDGA